MPKHRPRRRRIGEKDRLTMHPLTGGPVDELQSAPRALVKHSTG